MKTWAVYLENNLPFRRKYPRDTSSTHSTSSVPFINCWQIIIARKLHTPRSCQMEALFVSSSNAFWKTLSPSQIRWILILRSFAIWTQTDLETRWQGQWIERNEGCPKRHEWRSESEERVGRPGEMRWAKMNEEQEKVSDLSWLWNIELRETQQGNKSHKMPNDFTFVATSLLWK